MLSIEEVGLKEPIDVLEVEGKYYGFSGCHRYEVRPCRAPACRWLDQDSTQRQAVRETVAQKCMRSTISDECSNQVLPSPKLTLP